MKQQIEWVYWPDPRAVTKGPEYLRQYSDTYVKRKNQYPDYKPSKKAMDIALEIETNGFAKIDQCLDLNLIDKLNARVEDILNDAQHPFNQWKCDQKTERYNKLYLQIDQPALNIKEIHPFMFNDLIIDISSAYLDCYPAFGQCNLRKSFVNNLDEGGNQIYHVDPNSPRFLKFFIYLNDVDINGGPFCYIKGTHNKKFEINGINWNTKYNWDTKELEQIYNGHEVVYLTAKKGDLLVADTNGWHRGTKPLNTDRTMLTLDYTSHIEYFDETKKFLFKQENFNKLDNKHKSICDFLKLI